MEGSPSFRAIKVHGRTCLQLSKLVVRVSKVYLEIEESRPRCSSGIDALCLLSNGISKAKSIIHQCGESSALYLTFVGNAILNGCRKSCNMMEHSLSNLQNMVPLVLAAKISVIITDLRSTSFSRDESEEEVEKILRDLILRYSDSKLYSSDFDTVSDIRSVALRLNISSKEDMETEKRAIKKLCQREPSKKRVLIFFLELLKICGNFTASNDSCIASIANLSSER